MPRCGNDDQRPFNYTNLFVDLNGFPYLLGEYLDRQGLQLIDRSAIVSNISIDTSDAMRAVIDISIDDIGKRSSGYANITGNNTKQRRLLDLISKNSLKLDGQLPVLKSGIIIRVNYQLENQRTRQVMRSMVEDLRITNRSFFIDINQRNPNDNAIVVNFSNSIVSTINEFTHGRDRMVLRITNVQMFYESVTDRQPVPRIKQSLTAHPYDHYYNHVKPGSSEAYYYHDEMQHRHFLGDPCDFGNETIQNICPPTWTMFNQFYHFNDGGRSIVLHNQEIYDPLGRVILVPCGKVAVNRSFIINPGHRLIFKFSVWKNDVTAVFDTLSIAKAIKAKFYNCCDTNCSCDCDHDEHDHHHHKPHHKPPKPDHRTPEYEQLIQMLYDERQKNQEQGTMITELLAKIKELESGMGEDVPEIPDDPNCNCDCDCEEDHMEINERIDDLANQLAEEDIDPMTPETVEEIFNEVVNKQEGEI